MGTIVPISQRHRAGGLWRTRKTFGVAIVREGCGGLAKLLAPRMRTLFCRSNRPSSGPCVAVFILAGGHVRASAGALAVHTALILAGGHVRASAGALAVHTALIPCVCVCVCLSGIKLLSHHATNRDKVCFSRQVSTR